MSIESFMNGWMNRRITSTLLKMFINWQDHITSIALTESRKHLHNGDYTLAFPPSLLALKLLTETHGSAHLQLTPALLLLAQSSMGKERTGF